MKFEELSQYDIDLIKSLAIGLLSNTKMGCRYDALSETVLGCIYSKGYKLVPYPDQLSKIVSDHLKTKSHQRQWPADDVIKEIFEYLHSQNIGFVLDESREVTWKGPRSSWYTSYAGTKKPWSMF